MYSPMGLGTGKRGNGEASRCWTAADFYYDLPRYQIALQKQNFRNPTLIHFTPFRGKSSLIKGVLPAREEWRGASSGWQAVSVLLPEVHISKLVLTSLCQGLCWLRLMHLEREVTQYRFPSVSQMHFTAFTPSHYLISAARSHLVCADITLSGFLCFLTERMTHSSMNRHIMPRNRQYNPGS